MRYSLYCEYNFLTGFYDNRPIIKDEGIFSEDTQIYMWKKYCDLFLKNSNLYLNICVEDFINKSNHPFVKMIMKKKTEGSIKLKFDRFPQLFKDFDIDQIQKHAIFFISDNENCEQLQNNYGMLFISNDDLYRKASILFSDDTFRKIDNNTDWNILKQFGHPCNFILLIDNFIFSNEKSIFEKDFKMLFDSLLPQKHKRCISITIRAKRPSAKDLSGKENKHWKDWKEIFDDDDWKNKVEIYCEEIIKEKRPIKIKFQEIDNSEHDRHLITNYYWFSSGYGFILNHNQRAKGTDIHIHHITQPYVLDRMDELINKKTKE